MMSIHQLFYRHFYCLFRLSAVKITSIAGMLMYEYAYA